MEQKVVQIVTIKSKSPLFKGEEVGERIELIQMEELGFEVVSQKDLYEVGDKAVYIQPDYCLPDNIELFESFTAPDGNKNKSRLGKQNRIRALKFNFHKGDGENVYSMGILLPIYEVSAYINVKNGFDGSDINEINIESNDVDLMTELGIFKYEEPETGKSGEQKGDMPLGMYKTDENNFENVKNNIKYPINLIGTLKVDGSSNTCYINSLGEKGVCSRSFEKKLEQLAVIGYETPIGDKLRKHFDRDTMTRGWINERTEDFYVEVPSNYKEITSQVEDSWVKLGTPILDKLEVYFESTGIPLVARGEIVGQGLKGSGNKNNPHTKQNQQMLVYGLDNYESGITKKLPMKRVVEICKELEIEMVPTIFNKTFKTEKSLRKACNDYFKENMVEGIVLRSYNDTSLSTKFMNLEYDSNK